MFDIVVDYPDSLPAVEDMRVCLRHTNLHHKFVTQFRKATQERLLHPGAATTDIISQYVSTIKTLMDVDPAGVLLEAVSEPVRQYLRTRQDTIRCIVTMLTDDSGSGGGASLIDELGRSAEALPHEEAENEVELEGLEVIDRWHPDPVDANPQRSQQSRRNSDTIGMLIGIYGSKDLFIKEYRAMLADRLLAKTDYDCDREIRTLELLKLRFGDTNLNNCEVMLKDLADSKRLNASIKALAPEPGAASRSEADLSIHSATIVSALFWPPVAAEQLVLPGKVQAALSTYAARFKQMKAPRQLVWRHTAGLVKLAVTLDDRRLELSVSPLHATILLHFKASLPLWVLYSDQAEWLGSALAAALNIAVPKLRRGVLFWVNQGLVEETRLGSGECMYQRVESLGDRRQLGADDVDEAGAGGQAAVSAEEQLQQEMSSYQGWILGMLTNFEAGLALERIQNMLKMFQTSPPYDKTSAQLSQFLGRLVTEEKVTQEGDLYKLRSA
eukprot:jgi/Astpho2/7911/Aster-06390